MTLTKPVALVGIIGSGKSTIGRKLAKKLGMQFYDSDQIIEEREGLNVIDIHEYRGADYFRSAEEKVIKEILGYGSVVLSTGGSSFANDEVRRLIRDTAISVWLYSDLETIYARVARRNTRPGLDSGDRRKTLETIMAEQYPLLEEADIKVNSGEDDAHFIVDYILSKLRNLQQS